MNEESEFTALTKYFYFAPIYNLQGISPQSRDWAQISRIVGRFFTSWATREAQEYWSG